MKGLVRNIMQTCVNTIPASSTVAAAEFALMSQQHHCAPVVDANQKCVGVISDRDITALRAQAFDLHALSVTHACKPPAHYVSADSSLDEALDIMKSQDIHHLLVLDNQRVNGIVSIMDVLKEIQSQLSNQRAMARAAEIAGQLCRVRATTKAT